MPTDAAGAEPRRWLVAAGYNQFTALLRFAGALDRALHEKSFALSIGRMLGDKYMLRLSAARVLDGTISGGPETATVTSGWLFGAAVSRRYVIDSLPSLYIGGSAALAMQLASASYGKADEETALTAADVRFGATIGWTLWKRLVPYAAARVFGGPVSWRAERPGPAVSGSDRRHFQLGAGASLILPAGLYASAEWIPLGEQALSAELGARF